MSKTLSAAYFSKLKSSFKRIQALADDEKEIKIDGAPPIVVKVLDFVQSLKIQSASVTMFTEADGYEESAQLMGYMRQMHESTLAGAIVQIDDLDLRGVEFIETGEVTETGTPVKVPKDEMLKEFIARWNTTIVSELYNRYTEFQTEVESRIERAIAADVTEIDTEIERCQQRIQELNERKDSMKKAAKAAVEGLVGKMAEKRDAAPPAPPEKQEEVSAEVFGGATPEAPKAEAPQPKPRIFNTLAQPKPKVEEEEPKLPVAPYYDPDDSFIDPSDAESIAEAQRAAFAARQRPIMNPATSQNPRFRPPR